MKYLILAIGLLTFHWAHAQTKVLFPHNRQIFQRDKSNQAVFSVLGNCPVQANKVQVKLVSLNGGEKESTQWEDISPRPAGGLFNGRIKAKGGWYTLKVRSFKDQTLLDSAQLLRVGVGDNYLISGQSNAQGTIRKSSEQGATDDRVNVANFYTKDVASNQGGNYQFLGEQSLDFPMNQFVQMDSLSTSGPIGLSPYYWAALGDSLVKTYQVPVCFINTGWTATSIRNWVESAEGLSSTNPWASVLSYPKGFPYANLKRALEVYGKNMGFKAVLWHQGETDSNFDMPKQAYQDYLKKLIQYARRDAGFPIPWVIAEVSYFSALTESGCTTGKINMDIIQAQRDILNLDDLPNVYSGPNTDSIEVPRKGDNLSLCVHFTKDSYQELASKWLTKIKDLNKKEVNPMVAENLPLVSLYCDKDSTLCVKGIPAITGKKIEWLTSDGTYVNSATANQSLVAGKYQLVITDSLQQKQITPVFLLQPIVKPDVPTVTVNGTLIFCQGQQVNLEAKAQYANFYWSSGQRVSSISVNTEGTFNVFTQDDLGCKSNNSATLTTKVFANPSTPVISQLSPYFITGGVKLFDVDFNWSLNNLPINSEKGVNLRVNQAGTYKVFASKSNPNGPKCISPTVEINYILPADKGLSVYPNPAISSVTIQSKSNLMGASFALYSLDGRLVLDGTIKEDGAFGFKVDSLSAGWYKLVVKPRSNEVLQQTLIIGQ